jgi:hypothetical protein
MANQVKGKFLEGVSHIWYENIILDILLKFYKTKYLVIHF